MSKGTIATTKQPSTLVRPLFGPGMLLQHEDLELLTGYTRELSRLLFRSFFGCGVVCGLAVTEPGEDCGKLVVTVGAGLALDCSGDPVYVPKDQRLTLDDNCDKTIEGPLWVILCGATMPCGPRTSMCASDDDEATAVCARERAMFEIRVVGERPKCLCGCNPPTEEPQAEGHKSECLCADPASDCYRDHYAGRCGCQCGDGSDCGCDCILLARLEKTRDESAPWTVDHRVRRFIRPVLMRDPLTALAATRPVPAKAEPQESDKEVAAMKMQVAALTEENNQLKALGAGRAGVKRIKRAKG